MSAHLFLVWLEPTVPELLVHDPHQGTLLLVGCSRREGHEIDGPPKSGLSKEQEKIHRWPRLCIASASLGRAVRLQPGNVTARINQGNRT